MNKEEIVKLVKETHAQLGIIRKYRKKKLRAEDISNEAKIPFKLASIKELTVYRVVELTESALRHFQKANLVTAMVLTRSVSETVALMNMIYYKLNIAINSGNIDAVDSFLDASLVGRDNVKEANIQTIGIGKLIDRCENDFPRFKGAYQHLCGYAHPNYAGTLAAYGRIDRKTRTLELIPVDPTPEMRRGLAFLIIALIIFIDRYEKMEEQFHKFTNLCEQKLKKLKLQQQNKKTNP